MLVRLRDFGLAHAGLFGPSTVGGQMFAAVGTAVTALSSHAATQVKGRGAAREGTTSKAVGRRALRSRLEKISLTARAMAVDTPGLEDKFRLPDQPSDQGLLASARAFADEASALAAAFVAHEMPANFLVQLDAAIEKFEAAIRVRATGKGAHIAARAGIQAALQSGLAAVDNARRVERAARSKQGAAEAPSADTQATTAPATAAPAPGTAA